MAKHRQLVRQVGDSASSLVNSMADSNDANTVPEGTTFVFGSWACTADRSGGFIGNLITPKEHEAKPDNESAEKADDLELGEKLSNQTSSILDSESLGNASTPTFLDDSAESDNNLDSENFQFSQT